MVIKEPENEEDRSIVEEIKRKSNKKEKLTNEELVFAIRHPEYFLESEVIERINTKTNERILDEISVRYRNYKAWKK